MILLASLAGCPMHAQPSGYEGKRILGISYEPAQQPLSPKDLQRVQLLRIGSPLARSDVAETIDRMFASGRYEDIQVGAENNDGGVMVRFITRGARFVGHVGAAGKISNPPNQGQIINAAQLELGTPFH